MVNDFGPEVFVIANYAVTSGLEVPSDLMRTPGFGFNQSGGQGTGLSQEAEGLRMHLGNRRLPIEWQLDEQFGGQRAMANSPIALPNFSVLKRLIDRLYRFAVFSKYDPTCCSKVQSVTRFNLPNTGEFSDLGPKRFSRISRGQKTMRFPANQQVFVFVSNSNRMNHHGQELQLTDWSR